MVREQIAQLLGEDNKCYDICPKSEDCTWCTSVAGQILAIPELAELILLAELAKEKESRRVTVVDPVEPLPSLPGADVINRVNPGSETWNSHMAAYRYQQEMVQGGWIFEVSR